MAYIRYFDPRFGDLYEVYTDDITGEFESALRSVGGAVAGEKIYYTLLSELPPSTRHQIEHLIWQHSHPPSSSHAS
jgi:hypothetical protein